MSGETIHYAGVTRSEQALVSAGGRIFLAEATASTLEEAPQKFIKHWIITHFLECTIEKI